MYGNVTSNKLLFEVVFAIIFIYLSHSPCMSKFLSIGEFHRIEKSELSLNPETPNEIIQYIPECKCSRNTFVSAPLPLIKYDSSCSDEGTHFWVNQSVVTYSMHFSNKKDVKRKKIYKAGIRMNLERMREFYPGYTMRIYTDEPLTGDNCMLVCQNRDLFWCDIKSTPSLGDQSDIISSTWRFLVLGDPTVGIFLSRALGASIRSREAAAVRDWLEMDDRKAIHVMRDNLEAHNTEILGGGWGAKNYMLPGPQMETALRLRERIIDKSQSNVNRRSIDHVILSKVIFYPMKNDIVAYDSYHCERWGRVTLVRPFPQKRHDTQNDFVGNQDLGMTGGKALSKCPLECRPKYGMDWEYC